MLNKKYSIVISYFIRTFALTNGLINKNFDYGKNDLSRVQKRT